MLFMNMASLYKMVTMKIESSYSKDEKVLLATFFGMILFFLLVLVLIVNVVNSPRQISVGLDELSSDVPLVVLKGMDAFIVVDVSGNQLLNSNNNSVDDYRVFVAKNRLGYLFMDFKQRWNSSILCNNLIYIDHAFVHNKTTVPSAIQCADPSSQWNREHLIFNLEGESLSDRIADLYKPSFTLEGRRLLINL